MTTPYLTERVIKRLWRRYNEGMAHYGHAIEDSEGVDWLEEIADELSDALVYIEKFKEERANEANRS